MSSFRWVAIFIATVFGCFYNLTYAQTHVNYDSIPISFGYAVPDYRNRSIDDPQPLNELIFCDPIYRDSPKNSEYNYEEIYEALVVEPIGLEFFAGELSKKYVLKYFDDFPGDTITLLCADGKIPTIIKEIDYWGGFDFWQIGCRLELLNYSYKLSPRRNFIALRKSFVYAGPLYSYTPFPQDSLPNNFLDSLRSDCINKRIKQLSELNISLLDQNYNSYLRYCTLTLFIRNPKPAVDTILVTANLYDTLTDYFSRVYRVTHDQGQWKSVTLLYQSLWGEISNIGCSFDLNADGYLEYLVKESSEGASSVIYTDTDTGWAAISSGCAEWGE